MNKIKLIVHTIDEKVWESNTQDIEEGELEELVDYIKVIKKLTHLSITVTNGIGSKTNVYFNTDQIVAIEVLELT